MLRSSKFKRGSSNEKADDFYGAHTSGFFLNSCGASAIGVLVGGGTLGCAASETANTKDRCPALVAIDEQLKN